MGRAAGFADLALFALLTVGAIGVLYGYELKSEDAIATLVGALFGGAALLLGNWINRWNEMRNARAELTERVSKLKALITAELVNVAAGLIGAKETMDAAVATARAGGSLPNREDLTRDAPRPMPFTDNLGSELLVLDQRDIDVLATLRSSLVITRTSMDDVTFARRPFGYLTAQRLEAGIRHDMQILSEAFERFAPTRKLALREADPELASAILRRLSTGEA